MAYPLLSESDLLLGQRAVDDLHAARLNRGLTLPVQDVIDGAAARVRQFTARYTLTADDYRRLVRPLAVFDLMNFPGSSVPPGIKEDLERALAELRDIRDGKFADVLTPATTAPTGGAWGGDDRIALRLA